MDFKINNRYWLNRFVQDFFESEKSFFNYHFATVYEINDFSDRFVYKHNVNENDKVYFKNTLNKYKSILANTILHVKRRKTRKEEIVRKFYTFIKEKDKDNKLDLRKIKFEIIDLTSHMFSFGPKYYLILCDIDHDINFELIYGTLKVMNEI